jgi:hypothetical protein
MLYAISNLQLKWSLALLVLLAVGLFGTSPHLQAQTTASLSGNVVDTTGAVIPGATVSLTNAASRDKRDVTSNSSGYSPSPASSRGPTWWRLQRPVSAGSARIM